MLSLNLPTFITRADVFHLRMVLRQSLQLTYLVYEVTGRSSVRVKRVSSFLENISSHSEDQVGVHEFALNCLAKWRSFAAHHPLLS